MNIKPGINIWSILLRTNALLFLLFLILNSQLALYGQSVAIKAVDEPLNQLLMQMAKDYGIQLSFDDQILSAYSITLEKDFTNPEEAIAFLIKDYPLDFKQIGKVFTLYSTAAEETVTNFRLSGRVLDSQTGDGRSGYQRHTRCKCDRLSRLQRRTGVRCLVVGS